MAFTQSWSIAEGADRSARKDMAVIGARVASYGDFDPRGPIAFVAATPEVRAFIEGFPEKRVGEPAASAVRPLFEGANAWRERGVPDAGSPEGVASPSGLIPDFPIRITLTTLAQANSFTRPPSARTAVSSGHRRPRTRSAESHPISSTRKPMRVSPAASLKGELAPLFCPSPRQEAAPSPPAVSAQHLARPSRIASTVAGASRVNLSTLLTRKK